jgi:hypothetical protein
MDKTEEFRAIQKRIWEQYIVELSLTFHEARVLLEMIANLMDQGLSEDERIVVHFTGGKNMNSHQFPKYNLNTVSTILGAEIVNTSDFTYKVPRLIEAQRLVEYNKLIFDIHKSDVIVE